jgi:dihydrofolate reductase
MKTLLHGSAIDEMRVLTYPIVVGPGKRLFDGESPARSFAVKQTTVATNGVILAAYQPAGIVETGVVGP